jgi:hypothetical protein
MVNSRERVVASQSPIRLHGTWGISWVLYSARSSPNRREVVLASSASSSNMWWIGPLVAALLRLSYLEVISTRVDSSGSELVFRGIAGFRILLAIGTFGLLGVSVASKGREETWLYVVAGLVVVAFMFSWPPTITISEDAIRRDVWWRSAFRIPWSEVVGIERRVGGGWRVYAKSGKTITFSSIHGDPNRFRQEVITRARLTSVADEGAPTSLQL